MRRRLPALEQTESTDLDLDALETPSGSDGFEWEEELPHARGVTEGAGGCRTRRTSDRVDLSAVEPYSRVLSQGGCHGEGFGAVLLFPACHPPHSSVPRYGDVMENLLRYIMGTLERMVTDRYVLVCLSGAAARGQIPSCGWPHLQRQVRFVATLRELCRLIPVEPAHIPEPIQRLEPSWDGSRDVTR